MDKNFDLDFRGDEIMINTEGFSIGDYSILLDLLVHLGFDDYEAYGEAADLSCLSNIVSGRYRNYRSYKSISVHCIQADNAYNPLPGKVCCLNQSYGLYHTLYLPITPIDGRALLNHYIGKTPEEVFDLFEAEDDFEWAKEALDGPIFLKLEELEKGDIVIPTCVKQEEFIVMDKGLTVKLGEEGEAWVHLKRYGTHHGRGGLFLSNGAEIGRMCRFKLVSASERLEESIRKVLREEFGS